MLSKPVYGWTDITIEDWTDRASYLTNPAKDILNAIAETLRTNNSSVCYFDAEGWEYYLIFTPDSTILVKFDEEGNGTPSREFFISLEDLGREVISDVKENLAEWGAWGLDFEDLEQIKENKLMLSALCTKIWCQLPENNQDKEGKVNDTDILSR